MKDPLNFNCRDFPKLPLENADEYISDAKFVLTNMTGFLQHFNSNYHFREACQMIINAIRLFQEGYYDCAFYSLRESIEICLNALYLDAKSFEYAKWNRQETWPQNRCIISDLESMHDGFEDVKSKLKSFFDRLQKVKGKFNKYVHKQGETAYLTYTENIDVKCKMVTLDFEQGLKISIGAVALYRLMIDPLPVLFMDDDIYSRSEDSMTEPYPDGFLEKYIGEDILFLYKQTDIYKGFLDYFLGREKQNDAVFNLKHYCFFSRKEISEIEKQIHLLTLSELTAVALALCSEKIHSVRVKGIEYCTETKKTMNDCFVLAGDDYFLKYFSNGEQNFNIEYESSLISRIYLGQNVVFIEHDEELTEVEIEIVSIVAAKFSERWNKEDEYFSKIESIMSNWSDLSFESFHSMMNTGKLTNFYAVKGCWSLKRALIFIENNVLKAKDRFVFSKMEFESHLVLKACDNENDLEFFFF